jgi:immunity protein 8 of polymorphic toxin system
MQARIDLAPFEDPPEDPSNCCVAVEILAGELGVGGEELFEVQVCTPTWLAEYVAAEGPLVGRHYLIVDHFSLDQVRAYLTKRISTFEAPDWAGLAERLGRIGHWEFEDYRPYSE